MKNIPAIGATDGTPFDEKTIYQRWYEPASGFYWLVAEYDETEDLAFGFANLACDMNAEWGLIPMNEIRGIGAMRDTSWQPMTFHDAKIVIAAKQ